MSVSKFEVFRFEKSRKGSNDAHESVAVRRLKEAGLIIPACPLHGEVMLCIVLKDSSFYKFEWRRWNADFPVKYVGNVLADYGPELPAFPKHEHSAEEPVATAFRTQEGGQHYSQMPRGYQPFQISKALGLNPVEHTILKYLLRHAKKDGKAALLKAKHCIDILIEQEYPDEQ